MRGIMIQSWIVQSAIGSGIEFHENHFYDVNNNDQNWF